jgi:hypothetical protein
VRSIVGKLLVAALLTLCVGVHLLEVSGRWDRTFHDAEDEAGLVAVVLCIGVAISTAGAALKGIRLSRCAVAGPILVAVLHVSMFDNVLTPLLSVVSPPLPLRI